MAFCSKCGAQIGENQSFCSTCGTPVSGFDNTATVVVKNDPYDHTAGFDPQDISENKVIAMLPYLMGVIGVIAASLIAKGESAYVAFHIRQGLKLSIVSILLSLIAVVLCITIIVPIAAGIMEIIVVVLQIIAFFQVCGGKAKEPAIIRDLGFLK